MLKTTITWYKPEDKMPPNGEVFTVSTSGSITSLYVWNGHFNCFEHCLESEIDNIILWAEIPQKLKEEADKAWKNKWLKGVARQ